MQFLTQNLSSRGMFLVAQGQQANKPQIPMFAHQRSGFMRAMSDAGLKPTVVHHNLTPAELYEQVWSYARPWAGSRCWFTALPACMLTIEMLSNTSSSAGAGSERQPLS